MLWAPPLRHLDYVAIPALAFAISAVIRHEYFPVGDNWPLLTEIRHFLDPSYLARDTYAQEALSSLYVITRRQDMTCAGATVAMEDPWGYRVFEAGPAGWQPEACPP